jgi:hypothetical protein
VERADSDARQDGALERRREENGDAAGPEQAVVAPERSRAAQTRAAGAGFRNRSNPQAKAGGLGVCDGVNAQSDLQQAILAALGDVRCRPPARWPGGPHCPVR